MYLVSPFSNITYDTFFFPERLTYKQKKSRNAAYCREKADEIDWYAKGDIYERNRKWRLNYELLSGRVNMDNYDKEDFFYEELRTGKSNIKHHDITSRVAKSLIGEQIKRPYSPRAVDKSSFAFNEIKRKEIEMLQSYVQQSIVIPIQQEAAMQYMQQYQIQDPFSLDPQQQQQMQSDIQQRVEVMTPKEIKEYLRKDYRLPSERQAQQIIEYYNKELNLHRKFYKMFEDSVATSCGVIRIQNNKRDLTVDNVNPLQFYVYLSNENDFVQDGEFCKWERERTVTEIIKDHWNELTTKDLDRLAEYSSTYQKDIYADREILDVFELENLSKEIDIKRNVGQEKLRSLRAGFSRVTDVSVRETHCQWKALTKRKLISRVQDNRLIQYWVGESYKFNPSLGDIKEDIFWLPETWETIKLGFESDSAIYVKKRAVPYQYKSLENPFDTNLSYYGVVHNKFYNNAENVSIMDLAKPWQYWYNVVRTRIDRIQELNIGNVLLMFMGAKPKDWTWDKWLTMLKEGKIAVIADKLEGITNADIQNIRSLNLSNNQDLASALQLLQYVERNVSIAMGYNPSRLGEISPYLTVSNNQQNIVQSSHITESLFYNHNIAVEKILNAVLNCARVNWKDDKVRKRYILDDMSSAELDVDSELLKRSEIGIFLTNNTEETQRIESLKNLIQPMIQNQMVSTSEIVKIIMAKTSGEIYNIIEQAEAKRDEQMKEQQQIQQQQFQQQQQIQQQIQQQQLEWEKEKFYSGLENKIDIEQIQVDERRRMNDVNLNNEDDRKELELVRIANSLEELQMELEQKEKQLKSQKEIREMEIRSREREQEKDRKNKLEIEKIRNKNNKK